MSAFLDIYSAAAIPEIILAVYAMAALIWGAFSKGEGADSGILWTTALILLGLGAWLAVAPPGSRSAFGGLFIDDGVSRFSKVLILVSSALVLVLSHDYFRRERQLKYEFPVLAALSVVGMMTMVSAGDLMSMYMGIELQSLSLYVLAAFNRDSARSSEAGLKYFVLGALSSGLLLYGASLAYGFAGTTSFVGIAQAIEAGGVSLGMLFALAFMAAGLAFKVSAAPFHMWTPDVYEGAPTPVTAFFATAPKVAAMVLFTRLLLEAFGDASGDWRQILVFLSVASMFIGAIAAIGQRDIKRLMAYSSIAHMGFALMGICAGTKQGVDAMLLYIAIYLTMNIGTFAFILSMRRNGAPVTDIGALNMYSRQSPLRALALLLLLFSLAGIVPLVGFFAKFYVFRAALDAGMIWLVVAGGIASVIGAFYYLRIVYFMYFGVEQEPLDSEFPKFGTLALVASAALMLVGAVNLFGVPEIASAATSAWFAE